MTDTVQFVLNNKKDYYAILGRVEGKDLERKYKKMCLMTHPDKSTHPKAEEAFKIVKAAYDVLSDPAKRRTYDRHGADGVQRMESTGSPHDPRAQRRQHFGFQQGENPFETFFDPFAQQRRQHHRRHGQHMHAQEFELNGNVLLMLPLLFMFLLAMLLQNVSFVDDGRSNTYSSQSRRSGHTYPTQLFSLSEEGDFRHERTTDHPTFPDLKVSYYVTRHFYDQMRLRRTNLRTVDLEVLKIHRDHIHRRCVSERVSRRHRDAQPSCIQLKRYEGVP